MDKFEILRLWGVFKNIVRDFFISRNYLEVETPLLSPFLIPEPAIEVFKTSFRNPYGEDIPGFLIPSPELWMKRLLGMGSGSIFQICKSFRNSENLGAHHNPEFTMLEWYSVQADYKDSMGFTKDFLSFIANKFPGGENSILTAPFLEISMARAFEIYAGLNLERLWEHEDLLAAAQGKGITCDQNDTWEVLFNKIFLTFVEPFLPEDRPVVLFDYPAKIPTLAKTKGPCLERWELYLGGLEIANCYTEEIDKNKVVNIIEDENIRKEKEGCILHAPDRKLADFFHEDYPPCSGVALGMERLFMILMKIDTIKGVIFFPFSDIFDLKL